MHAHKGDPDNQIEMRHCVRLYLCACVRCLDEKKLEITKWKLYNNIEAFFHVFLNFGENNSNLKSICR